MKQIKDSFSYSTRWDSAGISCVDCKYCNRKNIADDWPTNDLKCYLHTISLNIELKDKGITPSGIGGDWFCKNFENRNEWPYAFPLAVEEFSTIKDDLEDNVLYEACGKEYLRAIPFDKLPKTIGQG